MNRRYVSKAARLVAAPILASCGCTRSSRTPEVIAVSDAGAISSISSAGGSVYWDALKIGFDGSYVYVGYDRNLLRVPR
ncbi:MAG: hypothetical protein ABR567_04570 [Myxococcales bacterium]